VQTEASQAKQPSRIATKQLDREFEIGARLIAAISTGAGIATSFVEKSRAETWLTPSKTQA
jgi:hypothetical protein